MKYHSLAPYRKFLAALVGATLVTVPLLSNGLTTGEWTAIITAYATALGVYRVTNAS